MKSGARAGSTAFLGYLALTLVMSYPLITRFASAIPGDSFDGWQNYWNLWWVKTALLEQHAQPWFTDLLYHPTGVSLLFHTLNVFNGLASLPIQLGWGLIPAYNAVVVFSFAAGGLGAYLLAREVLGTRCSRIAAFLAGIVFTFSPFHIAHLLGHMQLIALEWLPFFALYLVRSAGRQRVAQRRDAGMALLFLVLVGLCDWYYVLYCLILTPIVVACGAWRQLNLRPVLVATGIWAAWAIVFSPLLLPMAREALQFNFMNPDPQQSRILSADLLAFVTPQEFHPVWGAWAQERARVFTSTVSEHQVFAGFSVLALALVGLVTSSRRRVGAWGIAAGVFFVLALGPVLHVRGQTGILPGGGELGLPYALLQKLPFMNISRSVSRLDVMIMLALGIMAAGGVQWAMQRARPRAATLIGCVAIALVIVEFAPMPYPLSPPDTPGWYQTLANDPREGAVLNLPVNWDRPWYLLYQTVHGRPLTAAYISREDPRTLIDRAPVLQHFRHLGSDVIMLESAEQGRQVLADLGVGWVVLDRYKMPSGPEREVTEAGAVAMFAGREPEYQDDRLTAYAVTPLPVEQRRPYPILGVEWQPLDEDTRTRGFVGSAPIIIRAHEPGRVTLRVETAPGSAALELPRSDGGYELEIAVTPGPNELVLRTVEDGAGAIVTLVMVK